MDLSIVFPVLNERGKIEADIRAAADFLLREEIRGEIIVVDDGSEDGTSEVARRAIIDHRIDLIVIRHEARTGKGHAVRTGMLASRGRFAMFADSGLCVPFKFVLAGLDRLKPGGYDIAHGSRKLPQSIIVKPQPFKRRFFSYLYRLFLVLFMKVPSELSDTQCGFKMYKGDVARNLYKECRSNGFSFDVETILRAQRMGYQLVEFPVEWTVDPDSRTTQLMRIGEILNELRQIKKNL
jgi:dolichyl-phosphate beta-glucosyltransferase